MINRRREKPGASEWPRSIDWRLVLSNSVRGGLGWDVGSSPAGPCFAWFRSTQLVLVGSRIQLVVVVGRRSGKRPPAQNCFFRQLEMQ